MNSFEPNHRFINRQMQRKLIEFEIFYLIISKNTLIQSNLSSSEGSPIFKKIMIILNLFLPIIEVIKLLCHKLYFSQCISYSDFLSMPIMFIIPINCFNSSKAKKFHHFSLYDLTLFHGNH